MMLTLNAGQRRSLLVLNLTAALPRHALDCQNRHTATLYSVCTFYAFYTHSTTEPSEPSSYCDDVNLGSCSRGIFLTVVVVELRTCHASFA